MDEFPEISSGSQFLSPTGRIWTVRSVTPNGARVVLASPAPDGDHGAVMDTVAVRRMVRIDAHEPVASGDVALVETVLQPLTGV